LLSALAVVLIAELEQGYMTASDVSSGELKRLSGPATNATLSFRAARLGGIRTRR
jgi:hypothetical protein